MKTQIKFNLKIIEINRAYKLISYLPTIKEIKLLKNLNTLINIK